MKKCLLILVSLLASSGLMADASMNNEITDSFTDKIKSFKEEDKGLVVQFTRHAAFYKMSKSNPRFEELKSKLEKLKKEEKKVKIIAILPMMEIKDLND